MQAFTSCRRNEWEAGSVSTDLPGHLSPNEA